MEEEMTGERDAGSGHDVDGEGTIGSMIVKIIVLLGGVMAFLAFLRLPDVVQAHFPAGMFKDVLVELLHESGLLVIATILFSAGVGYIFFRRPVSVFFSRRIRDFTDRTVQSLNEGYARVSDSVGRRVGALDGELVLRWATEGHAPAEQYKSAVAACAFQYYEKKCGYQGSYVDSIIGKLVNTWVSEGYWRRNMSTDVFLETVDKPDDLASLDLVLWDETQSFTLVRSKELEPYSIPTEIGAKISPGHLAQVLAKLELSVKAGPVGEQAEELFKLSPFISRIDIAQLREGTPFEADGQGKYSVHVSYARSWLKIVIGVVAHLTATETTITVKQTSLLMRADRQYNFINVVPTRGLKFSMRLGTKLRDRMSFSDVTVTSAYYYKDAARNVEITKDEPDSFIRSLEGWVLPGSAVMVEWAET
jgi:hypothetical protein